MAATATAARHTVTVDQRLRVDGKHYFLHTLSAFCHKPWRTEEQAWEKYAELSDTEPRVFLVGEAVVFGRGPERPAPLEVAYGDVLVLEGALADQENGEYRILAPEHAWEYHARVVPITAENVS